MAYRFQPPRPSALIQAGVYGLCPLALAARERVVRIVIAPEDWRCLLALRGERALLLPSHPSEAEPSVVVGIARPLGESFRYVATHKIVGGFNGRVMQGMGAFSIRRGWPDRASLRTARRVLAEEDGTLVLSAEGETHMQNDPVSRGVENPRCPETASFGHTEEERYSWR